MPLARTVAVLALCIVPASARAQDLARVIVVDAVAGTPLGRARVERVVHTATDVSVLTTDSGEFVMPAASPQDVRITKAGYAATVTTIRPESEGESTVVRMARGGAISGRARSITGAPALGAIVRAVPMTAVRSSPSEFTGVVNDAGEYRVGGLPEGRYRVELTMRGTGRVAASPTVVVRPGDDVSGVDLTGPFPRPCRGIEPARFDRAMVTGQIAARAGYPIACALVRLEQEGRPARETRTNPTGGYAFYDVAPGEYTVEARQVGYVTTQYGRDVIGGALRRIEVHDGQRVSQINIRLPRGGAITGTLVDERGDPIEGVEMHALQVHVADGRRTATAVGSATTDDRGAYRLGQLMPGRYIVAAAPERSVAGDGAATGYADAYYPGTNYLDGAAPIDVEQESERGFIDFVRTQSRVARVTGYVYDDHGHPLAGSVILVPSQRSGAPAIEPRSAGIGQGGAFVFTNVAPGDYVVQASGDQRNASGAFGMVYVTVVDRDPAPITIATHPPATVHGRLIFEGGSPRAERFRVAAVANDQDRASPLAGVTPMTRGPDGTFWLEGLTGARRIVLTAAPPGWYLRAATLNGRDVLEEPYEFGLDGAAFDDLEVVVSRNGASISGGVADAGEVEYVVIVFSTTRERWFADSPWIKRVAPDRSGAFAVDALPPGEYSVIAVEGLERAAGAAAWRDPSVLDALSASATRVTLREGEHVETTLRLVHR